MHGEDRLNIKTQLIIVALKFAKFPDHISIDYAPKKVSYEDEIFGLGKYWTCVKNLVFAVAIATPASSPSSPKSFEALTWLEDSFIFCV